MKKPTGILLLLALALVVLVPSGAWAFKVGDTFELPAVQMPFEALSADFKTEYAYDPGLEGGSQALKFSAEFIPGLKSDGISPEDGLIINFE
jgi:hypothetical protein